MNLKSLHLLALIAAVGILSARNSHAAAITNVLAVSLNTFVQGANTRTPTNSPVQRDFVDKQTFTTQKMLKYLGDATGQTNLTAPGNFIEVVIPDGSTNIITIKSKAGLVLLDASSYITISFGLDDIFSRTLNDNTLQQTRTSYRLLTLSFTDANFKQLQVTGLATDRYTASAKSNGIQHESSTLTATVSGNGTLNGSSAVVNGTILLRGKDVLTD